MKRKQIAGNILYSRRERERGGGGGGGERERRRKGEEVE